MKYAELKTLFDEKTIENRIQELGKRIHDDYQGKELVAIGILNGAFIFMADLVRAIDFTVQCEFMAVSSYHDQKVSSGKIDLRLDVDPKKIKGKHVLLIEDIVDTGKSIHFLMNHLEKYEPASLKICALLFKEKMLQEKVTLDYLGFAIDPVFVVGYGLDYAGKYRNYPEVAIHQ